MLSSPATAASHRDAVEPSDPSRRTPADHASPDTPLVGGGVAAVTGAGAAESLVTASPAPVLITEQQVMFESAVAGAASPTAGVRQRWIVLVWQRLSLWSNTEQQPRRNYPYRRSSYIEQAAMAREMDRL